MKRPRPTTLEPLAPAVLVVFAMHLALVFGLFWGAQELRQPRSALKLVWMNPADFHDTVAAATPPKAVLIRPPVTAANKTPPITAPPKPVTPTPPIEAPVAKATLVAAPPQQAMPAPVEGTPLFAGAAMPKPAANRSITLRRAIPKPPAAPLLPPPPAPPMAGATLADMARLNTFRPAAPAPPALAAPANADLPPGLNLDAVDNAVNTAFYAAWTAPPLDAVPVNQRSARLTISVARDGRVLGSEMSTPSGSHALDDSILSAAAKVSRIEATLPSQFPKDSYDLELNFNLLP